MSHFNLAIYLSRAGHGALAHRLAVAVIRLQMGSGYVASTAAALSAEPAGRGVGDPVPSFAQVCDEVGAIEGVELARLLEGLPGPAGSGEEALAAVLVDNAVATIQPAADAKGVRVETIIDPRVGPVSGDPDRLQQVLEHWRPLIDGVVAAARGEAEAAQAVELELDELAASPDWATLVAALRLVVAGQRDPTELEAGLDDVDRAILAAVLARLGPEP